MEFNWMKASIVQNSREKPSIYLALCMMETLVNDVQKEAGCRLAECPIGDERLPIKLIWLCRTISDVYRMNRAEMDRMRDRLRQSVEQIRAMEKEIDELASDADRLGEVRQRMEKLNVLLAQAQEDKRKYDALSASCAGMQRELDQLRQFDPGQARAQLQELQDEAARLREQEAGLNRDRQEAQKKCAAVQAACDALRAELDQLERQTGQRQAEKAALQDKAELQTAAVRALEQSIAAQDQQLTALAEEYRKLQERHRALQAQREQRGAELGRFQTGQIDPLLGQLAGLKEQQEALENRLAQLQEECRSKEAQRDGLSAQLDAARRYIDQLNAQAAGCQEQIAQSQAEREALQEKIDHLKHSLGALAGQEKDLRMHEGQLQQEIADFVAGQIAPLSEQIDALEQEAKRLGEQHAQLQDLCRQRTDERDAARAARNEAAEHAGALQEEKDRLCAQIEQQQQEIGQAEQSICELNGQLHGLTVLSGERRAEEHRLQKEIGDYTAQELLPLRQSIEALEHERKGLEDQRALLQAGLDALRLKRNALVNEIAALREKEPEEQKILQAKETDRDSLRGSSEARLARIAQLDAELQQLTDLLGSQQDRLSELEQKQIPVQRRRVEDTQQNVTDCEERLRVLHAQEEQLAQDYEVRQQEMRTLSGQVEDAQKEYNALTAEYEARDQKLRALRDQLDELRSQTDLEKHARYQSQLESSIAEMERVQTECAELEAQLEQRRAQLANRQSACAKLQEQKKELLSREEQLERLLSELTPVGAADYSARLNALQARLDQLSGIRRRLQGTLDLIQNTLGAQNAAGAIRMLDRITSVMQGMNSQINTLKRDLAECARTVRLEER